VAGDDGVRADVGRVDVEKGRRIKSPGRLTRRSEGAGGSSSPPPPKAAERRDGHREATVGDGGVDEVGDAVNDEPVIAEADGEVHSGDGGGGDTAAATVAASGHASAAAQGVMDDGERARPDGGAAAAATGDGDCRAAAAALSLASICRRRRRSCAPSTATGKPVPRATTVTRRPIEFGARRSS